MLAILDIIVAAIIIFCCYRSIKKGFVKSLFGLVGGIAAFILALLYSDRLGDYINIKYISPAFEKKVTSYLTELLGGAVTASGTEAVLIDSEINNASEGFKSYIAKYGVSMDKVKDAFLNSPTVEQGREAAVNAIYSSLSQTVSRVLSFAIIFFGVLLISAVLSRIIGTVFKLPLLSQLNGLLGLVVGVAKSAIFVWIFVSLITVAFTYLQSSNVLGFGDSDLNNTIIFKYFMDFSPFNLFFRQ